MSAGECEHVYGIWVEEGAWLEFVTKNTLKYINNEECIMFSYCPNCGTKLEGEG